MPAQRGILVSLDGSVLAERALRYAVLLPSGFIRLVAVQPIALSAERERWARDLPSPWGTWPIDDAKAYLELIADQFRERGWDVETHVLSGKPGPTIVQAATNVELIVMSTRGHGLTPHLLGSTADYVVGHAGAPTLLIRDSHPDAPAVLRIVVPLDGSEHAEEAVPLAAMLGEGLGVGLLLVRVIDPATSIRTVEELTEEASAYLETQKMRLGELPSSVETEVLVGSPEEILPDELHPGDLVVMTTQGHGRLRRFLEGSVSAALVDRAPVPVALIRAAPGDVAAMFDPARERMSVWTSE